MKIVDFIIIGVIALVIFLAIRKIVKDKRNGVKCVGCSGCSACNVNGNKNLSKDSPCSSCPSHQK